MSRKRFSLNMIASSRGNYVRKAHQKFIREEHERNQEYIQQITLEIKVTPKYYVRCFGVEKEITEKDAMAIGLEMVIIR